VGEQLSEIGEAQDLLGRVLPPQEALQLVGPARTKEESRRGDFRIRLLLREIVRPRGFLTPTPDQLVQQILLMRMRVQLDVILRKVLGKTLFMVQTVWKMLTSKVLISSHRLSA